MKFSKIALAAAVAIALTACGQRVEVGPNQVGKVMTSTGYADGLWETSSRRLATCYPGQACQKLVTLDVGDLPIQEPIEVFLPKSKMKIAFTLNATMSTNMKKVDTLYSRVTPNPVDGKDYVLNIQAGRVYNTYVKQIILTEVVKYLSQYSIEDIMSNFDGVNQGLQTTLTKSIADQTPMIPRFIGMAKPEYPEVITKSQIAAAQRRESIASEEAQLEVSKVQLERELQEQKARRKVEVEKAESDAQVNLILAKSMTPAYIQYRQLEVLEKMAASDNKVFVPVGSLNSVAVQNQISK